MLSQFLTWSHRQIFLTLLLFPCQICYWSKFHVNIITGSGVMKMSFYKGLTRNLKIGKTLVGFLPNICRLVGWVKSTKFGTNLSNKMLLNSPKRRAYSFSGSWVIKGKSTVGKVTPSPNLPILGLRDIQRSMSMLLDTRFHIWLITTLYYKILQILLRKATTILLQNATEQYYKMGQVFYYKMQQFYYEMRHLLQIVTVQSKIFRYNFKLFWIILKRTIGVYMFKLFNLDLRLIHLFSKVLLK